MKRAADIVDGHMYRVKGALIGPKQCYIGVKLSGHPGHHWYAVDFKDGSFTGVRLMVNRPPDKDPGELELNGHGLKQLLELLKSEAMALTIVPVDERERQNWAAIRCQALMKDDLTRRWGKLTYLGPTEANLAIFGRCVLNHVVHKQCLDYLVKKAPAEMKDVSGKHPLLRIGWARENAAHLLDEKFGQNGVK